MLQFAIYLIILKSCFHLSVVGGDELLMPPILPTLPPDDCNGPNDNWKYYHEECKNDSECFGNPYAMVCKNHICECTEDFEPSTNNFPGAKITCVSAPYLFQKCTKKCHRPGKCLPFPYKSSAEGKTEEAAEKRIRPPINRVCQCVKPFVFEKGNCFLRCKENEEYDQQNYKCIPKCNVNEVKINNTCYPFANLGQKCEDSEQCRPAYSYCKHGICACRQGFSGNKTCEPREYVCPIGKQLKKGDGPRFCHTFFAEDQNPHIADLRRPYPPIYPPKLKDDCPNGSFCLIPSTDYPQVNQTGYCCPDIAKPCPLGNPHPTLKCGQPSPDNQYCPYKTYYCNNINFGSYHLSACCPKGCANDLVQIGKKCYPRVKLGDKCVFNQQCQDQYAECLNGTCKCTKGSKEAGGPFYHYCLKECKFDEILSNGNCIKRLHLNDSCTIANGYLCPENAFCNKHNRCACNCNYIKLAKDVCAPQPSCPYGVPHTTYCRVWGKDPPTGVKVSKCPADEFCTYYISHLGQCCPRPERRCYNGLPPKPNQKSCDTYNQLSCGLDYTCYKYVNPIDENPDSKNNTICCPQHFIPIPGPGPVPL